MRSPPLLTIRALMPVVLAVSEIEMRVRRAVCLLRGCRWAWTVGRGLRCAWCGDGAKDVVKDLKARRRREE
jgi:hypothetical protein